MKTMRDVISRLALLAEQSGDKVSDARLKFTAEKIFEYGADEVCTALEILLESSRRFPTIAEIKTVLGISELNGRDLGSHAAHLLVSAMAKYGDLNGAKQALAIKMALGDSLWKVVDAIGGWSLCIERASENMSAFMAQTRDLVSSYAACGIVDLKEIPKSLPAMGEAFSLAEANPAILPPTAELIKKLADDVKI